MSEAVAEAVKSPEDRGVARVAWLEAAVGSRPADGTAWGRLGRAYREVGQDELALRALRRAADLGTRESDDWYWLSVLARRAGHRAEALAAARVAARQATGGSRELVNLATQLLEHDKPHEAIPYLDEAMRLAPGRPEPIGLLGIAHYDAGRYGAAAECLEAALRIHPDDNVHAWARLGEPCGEPCGQHAGQHSRQREEAAKPRLDAFPMSARTRNCISAP
jgi:tetratricopeptide (TPR) repeat protein